jgi:hypothetical protein
MLVLVNVHDALQAEWCAASPMDDQIVVLLVNNGSTVFYKNWWSYVNGCVCQLLVHVCMVGPPQGPPHDQGHYAPEHEARQQSGKWHGVAQP